MRIATLVIGGFVLLACTAELQAQASDTSSARTPAFPKPAKAKVQAAKSGAAPARGDVNGKGMLPPKTKTTAPAEAADSLPVIAKPPKGSRPPA